MFLPPDAVIARIAEAYGDLLARRGTELGVRPLVLPSTEFFPDRFDKDEASAARLVARMQAHAGLDDVPITVRVIGVEGESAGGGGCGSGACGPVALPATNTARLVDQRDSWLMNVPEQELGAPVVLTAMCARALGHVFLAETARSQSDVPEDAEATADLAAVALGLGTLLLEGAHIYSKGCGGPQIGKVTSLSLSELALAFSLFLELGGHSARVASRALSPTQREALDQTVDWARSNGALVATLRSDPARVARGDFALSEPKPWLLRFFGKKAPRQAAAGAMPDLADLEASLATRRAAAPKKVRSAEDDELKALVNEAFSDSAHVDAE